MTDLYGYARISTPKQDINRQLRNITSAAGDKPITIFREAYTGKIMARPEWQRLKKRLRSGDTVIFDSVSRMSRNAEEGVKQYFELHDKGIQLVFLKEPYINTETYDKALTASIASTGNEIADIYIDATNHVLRILAASQIRAAFDQAEKEAQDIRQRTREGLETARANGKQVGGFREGVHPVTKKSIAAKEIIRKHAKVFGGSLSDAECQALVGCSRNSYYKYKRELIAALEAEEAVQEDGGVRA